MRGIDDVIQALPATQCARLPAPPYANRWRGAKLGLAVESMKRHMTDEGWQIFAGLECAGYQLSGHGLPYDTTNVPWLLETVRPDTVVLQDKREWDLAPRDFRDPEARFREVEALADHPEIFKLTILKDAHQRPEYHRQAAEEIGCHAWIVYYAPRIVCHLAPYVRPKHLIRTYHSVDADLVPSYKAAGRKGCLLSGAVSDVYPLRQRLIRERAALPDTVYFPHPGYHRNGCQTPTFLKELSKYQVAICTSSIYGYALRKLIEATTCGCIVVTDLPFDEVLPEIDGNLVRVDPAIPSHNMGQLLRNLYARYDPEKQQHYAERAKTYYDYRVLGRKLAEDIEALRKGYACT